MTEWWNKKYEFKIWSSLWVFLKEVEEVEEKRARYYLEQLLEKRYDTVDVLALATKQDLVEDANVVPGDALRIIAAAKEVVAQRDVDRAGKLTSDTCCSTVFVENLHAGFSLEPDWKCTLLVCILFHGYICLEPGVRILWGRYLRGFRFWTFRTVSA
jgi:hypothetical protein